MPALGRLQAPLLTLQPCLNPQSPPLLASASAQATPYHPLSANQLRVRGEVKVLCHSRGLMSSCAMARAAQWLP